MIGCKDTRPTVQICLFNVIFQDFFFYLLVIQPVVIHCRIKQRKIIRLLITHRNKTQKQLSDLITRIF